MVINGEIGGGICCCRPVSMHLCEIYLEVISGTEKPSINVLFRNAFTLATIIFRAEHRISNLVELVRQNPRFDPSGHFIS